MKSIQLKERLSALGAGSPHQMALSWRGECLNFKSINLSAQSLADRLASRGVKAGEVIVLESSDPLHIVSMVYAALHLGVAVMPLNPEMQPRWREALIQQLGGGWLCIDPLGSLVPLGSSEPINAIDSLQLVIATSGTSGKPRGVMLSAGALAASAHSGSERVGLVAGDCWLNPLPLYHIGGLSILLRTLHAGAMMVLQEGFDPQAVWQTLREGTITHISLVPAMLARLLDHADEAPPASLRVALIGGAQLAPELADRARAAGWPLCVSYGMSEMSSQVATDCGPEAGRIAGRVGAPLAGVEVSLEPDSGRIRLRGGGLMLGYLNPRLTPGLGLDDGWLETGDIGKLDSEGNLTVVGRADEMLISGGLNIHPLEVEQMIQVCPGVDAAGVCGQADPVWGDRLVALYTGTISEEALEVWCREQMPDSMRPRHFCRVPSLPINSMGKLERQRLREMIPA
ncbi:MAG: 2-succinylbenzoate--CoA ligase [Gammaproteobacteria bacterium]|nr:2-succinylbenzoate--CoA ligase [Gammaproteobacteria bacterium]